MKVVFDRLRYDLDIPQALRRSCFDVMTVIVGRALSSVHDTGEGRQYRRERLNCAEVHAMPEALYASLDVGRRDGFDGDARRLRETGRGRSDSCLPSICFISLPRYMCTLICERH